MKVKDCLPTIYRQLVAEDVLQQSIDSIDLDCVSCQGPQYDDQISAATKCCHFQPRVPNFLISPQWDIHKSIATQSLLPLLPVGLLPTPEYIEKFNNSENRMADSQLVCGFYDQGLCKIWQHRESECSFFFCAFKVDEKLKSHIRQREYAFIQFSILQMGYDIGELKNLWNFFSDPTSLKPFYSPKGLPQSFMQDIWAHYYGREQEFFHKVHQLCLHTSAKDLDEFIMGQ